MQPAVKLRMRTHTGRQLYGRRRPLKGATSLLFQHEMTLRLQTALLAETTQSLYNSSPSFPPLPSFCSSTHYFPSCQMCGVAFWQLKSEENEPWSFRAKKKREKRSSIKLGGSGWKITDLDGTFRLSVGAIMPQNPYSLCQLLAEYILYVASPRGKK